MAPLCKQLHVRSTCVILTMTRFLVLFFTLTFILNRPCIYCSALLLILFVSSCAWSDRCLLNIQGNWFSTRHFSSLIPNPLSQPPATSWPESTGERYSDDGSFLIDAINETASALAGATLEEVKRRMAIQTPEWTGIGGGWMRSWLGARQWRIPCVDVYIRL